MREAFPDPAYGAPDSALNSTRRVGELDILLIDSTVPDAVHDQNAQANRLAYGELKKVREIDAARQAKAGRDLDRHRVEIGDHQ